jgi:hypothetical protein
MYIAILCMESRTALFEACSLRIQGVLDCSLNEEFAEKYYLKEICRYISQMYTHTYVNIYIYIYIYIFLSPLFFIMHAVCYAPIGNHVSMCCTTTLYYELESGISQCICLVCT